MDFAKCDGIASATPTIDVAVTMRDLSVLVKQREQASQLISTTHTHLTDDHRRHLLQQLKDALFTGMIIVYAQGMALLKVASDQYDYQSQILKQWHGFGEAVVLFVQNY